MTKFLFTKGETDDQGDILFHLVDPDQAKEFLSILEKVSDKKRGPNNSFLADLGPGEPGPDNSLRWQRGEHVLVLQGAKLDLHRRG